MKRLRDSQRSKVYNAERLAFSIQKFYNNTGMSTKDIEDFIHKMITTPSLVRRYHNEFYSKYDQDKPMNEKRPWKIHVKAGQGVRYARGGRYGIIIPGWARNYYVICHELAHTISIRKYEETKSIAAHGWEFCEIYLNLVRFMINIDDHNKLKASFKEHKIKYKESKKSSRVWTDEMRATFRQRMIAGMKRQEEKNENSN
jgi:putative metallohydrolase (TIGR04338 family)